MVSHHLEIPKAKKEEPWKTYMAFSWSTLEISSFFNSPLERPYLLPSPMKFCFFSLLGYFFTDTDYSQGSKGREETMFYSSMSLPPAHEHSDIYLQLWMWDDYYIFLIVLLVTTSLSATLEGLKDVLPR